MPGLHGGQSSWLPDLGSEVEPFTLFTQIFGSIHWNIFLNWTNWKILGRDGGYDDDGSGDGGVDYDDGGVDDDDDHDDGGDDDHDGVDGDDGDDDDNVSDDDHDQSKIYCSTSLLWKCRYFKTLKNHRQFTKRLFFEVY
jgi:hypothetical protein